MFSLNFSLDIAPYLLVKFRPFRDCFHSSNVIPGCASGESLLGRLLADPERSPSRGRFLPFAGLFSFPRDTDASSVADTVGSPEAVSALGVPFSFRA